MFAASHVSRLRTTPWMVVSPAPSETARARERTLSESESRCCAPTPYARSSSVELANELINTSGPSSRCGCRPDRTEYLLPSPITRSASTDSSSFNNSRCEARSTCAMRLGAKIRLVEPFINLTLVNTRSPERTGSSDAEYVRSDGFNDRTTSAVLRQLRPSHVSND